MDILNELPELLDSIQENWEVCKAMFPADHANQIACIKEILLRVCEVLETCQGDIFTGDTDGDGKCNDLDTDDDDDGWSDSDEITCGSDPLLASSVPVDGDFNCGLQEDGTVVCWGGNNDNQVSPLPVGGFTNISAGWYYVCGL